MAFEIKAVARESGRGVSLGRFWLAMAAVCLLVVMVYGNGAGNSFVWDDHQQIVMNPAVQAGVSPLKLLTTDARFAHFDAANQTTVYRPLQMLAYWLGMRLWGPSAAGFHLVSLFFAVAGAGVALWLFTLLTGELAIAFSAAALFALHPMHTEAVDWIASLPDLGCGLCVLWAMALFVRGWRGWSVALFAAALLWKETALVFPVLIAGYAALYAGEGRLKTALQASAPFWAVLAAYLGIRTAVLGAVNHSPRTWMLGPMQFCLTAADLMAEYWWKLLAPLGLNAYHVFHPVRSAGDARGWVGILVVAALVAGCGLLVRRARLAAFAIAWVLLTLLPVLNLNALGRNALAERYLYLPSAGFCLLVVLLVGWALGRLPQGSRRVVGMGLLLAVCAVCAAEVVDRNPEWKDDATLFAATLPKAEDSPFVHLMVAAEEANEPSEAGEAEGDYREAVRLARAETPMDRLDAVIGLQGLASVEATGGHFGEALGEIAEARRLAPENPDTNGEEGMILAQQGRGAEAEPLLERARDAQPDNVNVLTALALIARAERHDPARAEGFLREVLRVHGEADAFAASTHNNLGGAYGDQGLWAQAIEEFKQSVAIVPSDAEYRMNLASSYAASGHFAEAREQAQVAIELAPNDPQAADLLRRVEAAGH